MRLSVVIPVYNEVAYLGLLLHRVQAVTLAGVEQEILVVDDCSTDGTREFLQEVVAAQEAGGTTFPLKDGASLELAALRVLLCDRNQGKGAALRRGFAAATGEIIVVQDADLEYDPQDYHQLLRPILAGVADVVYGSRFLGGPHRVLYFSHYLGNRLITFLSNVLTNVNLSDMETCYKAFRADVLRRVTLRQNRFGFEPEVTAKVAKLGCRMYEVPISYYGRTYAEGKKIGWWDAVNAIWCIFRYNVLPF